MADATKAAFRVAFRADASREIGTGHVMRCLALADRLAGLGAQIIFFARPESADIVPGLKTGPWAFVPLPVADDQAIQNMEEFLEGRCDLLIVDHYGWDATQESRCRNWTGRIMVIDDLANRDHDCDFLLDTTPKRSKENYRGKISENTVAMTGPDYALLRRDFSAARQNQGGTKYNDQAWATKIFVSMGGVDAANATFWVMDALESIAPVLEITIALSDGAPHIRTVQEAATRSHHTVVLRIGMDVVQMIDCMIAADVSIGAPGTTTWERCCLGLPSVLLAVADNQMPNGQAMEKLKGADFLGTIEQCSAADFRNAVETLIEDNGALVQMGTVASRLVDGRGADRVAAIVMTGALAKDDVPVWIRKTTLDDGELMLRWQRHPNNRAVSRNSVAPNKSEHFAWLESKLDDASCIMHVIMHGDQSAGIVLLDRDDSVASGDNIAYEVSIYIAPEKYRQGVVLGALRIVRAMIPLADIFATIQSNDKISARMFLAAGYLIDGPETWLSKARPPVFPERTPTS